MKRKLALLLALVMVISMIPMSAFAASGNTETIIRGGVPRVADDYDSEVRRGEFTSLNSIIIRQDNYSVDATNFQLRIENGSWSGNAAYSVTDGVYGVDHDGEYSIASRTDRVLDIQLDRAITSGNDFEMPLYFKADGSGPVRVTVDPLDSGITGGTFTVANTAAGATITTIDDVITFSEVGSLDPIRIEETSMGSLGEGTHRVRLRLPSNFEWTGSEPTVRFINGLNGKASDNVTRYDGQRDLEIEITIDEQSRTRGAILIEGAQIYATSAAREGDVEVRVSGGDVTSETFLVAKYSDFDVTVKADGEPAELISGRFESNFDDEAHELQTLVIEEEVRDALLNNRRTTVELPSWVKILGVDVDVSGGDSNITFHGVEDDNEDRIENVRSGLYIFEEEDRGSNDIEFTIDSDSSDETKVELTFYVSVQASREGDIEAVVSGRSGAEGTVVLGTARKAVDFEVVGAVTTLDIGTKGQPIPDMIISEIDAEDILEGELIVNLSGGVTWDDYTVTVVDGDLEIDDVDDSNNQLILTFTNSDTSSVPSTIEITNAAINVDRTPADGAVNARIAGDAVRPNFSSANGATDEGYFDTGWVHSVKIADILAGGVAPGTDMPKVVLTIGSSTFTVDGNAEVAPAAPYIDAQNRTMLPLSIIGRTLGAEVDWNEASRTVLVTKGSDRVLFTIGSDAMVVNGMSIPMRSQAVITGDRTFIPLRDLGIALGVDVQWDEATRTVTIN
ncbi:copper amine oxidase N-terminal domain-containing protein [Alkaliphilus metalliredigens]|uniref:copper amine oxidase N-terminal domain-containing protein n=1 Tax=Alkaliphilus metalliredigens TaxID=208226 RepID=UPI0018DE8509|nr:copper amine oxidase N-terminal domain-containing protein [Alkaliphilus metalliredigens]